MCNQIKHIHVAYIRKMILYCYLFKFVSQIWAYLYIRTISVGRSTCIIVIREHTTNLVGFRCHKQSKEFHEDLFLWQCWGLCYLCLSLLWDQCLTSDVWSPWRELSGQGSYQMVGLTPGGLTTTYGNKTRICMTRNQIAFKF